jgi:hypothetical protein
MLYLFYTFVLCFTHSFIDPSPDKFMTLKIEQVQQAHELWVQANVRANDRKTQERERLEREDNFGDEEEVDMEDIKKLFSEKGPGPHMLELDFEAMTLEAITYQSVRTGKPTTSWSWKHRLTGVEVKRYPTKSGKSFDTGVLSSYLSHLKKIKDRVAYERAVLILSLNTKGGKSVKDAVASSATREELLRQWVSVPDEGSDCLECHKKITRCLVLILFCFPLASLFPL